MTGSVRSRTPTGARGSPVPRSHRPGWRGGWPAAGPGSAPRTGGSAETTDRPCGT